MAVAPDVTAVQRPIARALVRSTTWLEDVSVIAAALLLTLWAEWRILGNSLAFQPDAQIHEYWMRRFQDSGLFHDPVTEALLSTGYSPPLFRLVYWLASHVADPVLFGELLPLVLQPLAVWLVFRIVRAHTSWWPAAWIGAGLFLVPWEIHRFSGGHPRAFAQPIVLLTVLLLLQRRHRIAALVPPVGVLLYPPAGIVALAIVALGALARRGYPFLDRGRAAWAALSAVAVAAAVLAPQLFTDTSAELLTEAEARRYPEFGWSGQMHFFAPSTLDALTQNYSGFFLRTSGSILAVAAVALLVARPRNFTLLRWEVWCMPIASLALFGAAHALLFRLYLPHRYTYALLPFFCIAIAVVLRPTLEALAARGRVALVPAVALPLALALLALTVFPLGPQLSLSDFGSWLVDVSPYLAVGFAAGLVLAAALWARAGSEGLGRVAAAATAVLVGAVLVAEVAFAGGGKSPAVTCKDASLYRYLQTLPKDAVVAGDPLDLNCIPIAARRPVVISRKLYQPWEPGYFELIRDRMFSTVRGYYGSSPAGVVELRARHGADYILVRIPARTRPWRRMAPFTGELRRLLRTVEVPAANRLPAACRTWRGRTFEVYELACVARERSG